MNKIAVKIAVMVAAAAGAGVVLAGPAVASASCSPPDTHTSVGNYVGASAWGAATQVFCS